MSADERGSPAIPIALGLGVIGALALVKRRYRTRVEQDSASELANVFLSTGTATPASLRAAAAEIRNVNGDADLASALDETAANREREARSLPVGGERVYCRPWSTCTFYAEPTILSSYVDGLSNAPTLRAVTRTETGWTRVIPDGPATLVIDPGVSLVTGWIRTDNLTTNPADARLTFRTVTAAEAEGFVYDARAFGEWVTSVEGQFLIHAVAATANLIPIVGTIVAAGIEIFVAFIVIMNETLDWIIRAAKALKSIVTLIDETPSIEKLFKMALFYQVGRLTSAYNVKPEMVEKVGLSLPADRRRIGETRAAINVYTSATYAAPALFVAGFNQHASYADVGPAAHRIAQTQGIDLDLALSRISKPAFGHVNFSPARLATDLVVLVSEQGGVNVPTPRSLAIQQYGTDFQGFAKGRVYALPVREDAVALAMNNVLRRKLYSPDWYDSATGNFVRDRTRLQSLIRWEEARLAQPAPSRLVPDPVDRDLHRQRLAILQRALGAAPRAAGLVRVNRDRRGPDQPLATADQLLESWQSAKQTGQSSKIVGNLFNAYQKALEREAAAAATQKAADAAYAQRRAAPDPTPVTSAASTASTPRSFLSQLLIASLITSPAWGTYLFTRRSTGAGPARSTRRAGRRGRS